MNRDFRRYFSAEATSVFGSSFSATAIGIVGVTVFAATPAELGVVSAAAALPAFLLGPAAGVIGDRLRRPRRGLILCDCVAGCAVLAVAAGVWLGAATIWWLAGLCLVLGCVTTLVETIYFTHLRGLVGPDDLTTARARLQAGEYGASTAGRALTGALIAALGGAAAFAVDALSYLASILLLAGIRAPDRGVGQPDPDEAPAGGLLRAAATGFAETMRHSSLRPLIAFAIVGSWVGGALATLTAPFLLRTLAMPAGLYGLLFALTGLAGLAGSLLAGRLVRRAGPRLLAVGGSGGIVLTSALLPLAGGPVPLAAAVAVLGLGLPVSFGALANVGLTGMITDSVPEDKLGRVGANLRTFAMASQVFGALAGGIVGDALGLRPAVWLCAGMSMAGGLFLVPAIRAPRAPQAFHTWAEPEPAAEPAGGLRGSAG